MGKLPGGAQLAKGRVGAGAPKDKHQGRVKNEGGGDDGSQLGASGPRRAGAHSYGSLRRLTGSQGLTTQPFAPRSQSFRTSDLRFPPAPFCCTAYQPY